MNPRLVLVHGTRMSGRHWDRYAGLVPEAEVVAPDLPGHGDRLGERFSTGAAMVVLREAVEGAAPGQPVIVVGHSLGGYMAMVYAARHPERLASLVLVGASADPRSPAALVYKGFAAALPRVGFERVGRGMNGVMSRLGTPPDLLPDNAAYPALADAWDSVMTDCRPELLADVDCPVVFVNGQFDQMRIGIRQFRAHCRRSTVITVPGATHLVPLTHSAELAEVLRKSVAEAA